MEYNIGDIIEMKKQHPCGNKKWEITRIGVDFKFKCLRVRTCNCGAKRESIEDDKKEICINIIKRREEKMNAYLLFYILRESHTQSG